MNLRTAAAPRCMSEFWQTCSPSGFIALRCFDTRLPRLTISHTNQMPDLPNNRNGTHVLV
jgi:hypothetical protein